MEFFEQYNQFFPLMSAQIFGDNFLANNAGSSATISGNNSPEINQQIATTGPERFLDLIPGISAPMIGVGVDAATIEQRRTPTRFNNFLDRVGVGMLALILIAAGIIYLGFVGYRSGGGSITEKIKGAAGV